MPAFLAIGIFVAALTLRLVLTLTHEGFLGVDGGAYLLSRNMVLGFEPTGAGFPRPPLAPGWLLVPFTSLWGDDNGYKAWAAVFALPPLFPVYFLTRTYVGIWPAVFITGFAALDLMHAEMMVTGALPLIGFGLIGMAWWSIGQLAQRRSWRVAILLAVCIGLVPWVNQTSAGLAFITLPVYAIALLWYHHRADSTATMSRIYRIAPPAVLGGVIGLGALPWYLAIAPGSAILHYPGPWIYPSGAYDVVWFLSAMGLSLGIWVARKAGDARLQAMGVVLTVLAALSPWLSFDETVINIFYRSQYLMAVPFYVCVSWAIFTKWLPSLRQVPELRRWWAPGSVALAAVAGGLMLWGTIWQFNGQARYSDMITPTTAAALGFVPDGEGIVTNSFTLSLWVAALKRSPAPHTWNAEPPRAYTETDQQVRCVLGWVPGCDPFQSKKALKVEYVLIDRRFPYLNDRSPGIYQAPPDLWEVTAEAPWLRPLPAEGTTRLWRIEDGTP